jgi:hypothetical protein
MAPASAVAQMRSGGSASTAEMAARATFAQSLPPEVASQVLTKDDSRKGIGLLQSGIAFNPSGGAFIAPGSGVMQAGGPVPPGAVVQAGGAVAPPTALPQLVPPVPSPAPGVVAAVGALKDSPPPFAVQRTSVRFTGPTGMKVSWYVPGPDGKPEASPNAIEVPGRYNFLQAAIYRLKLSNIPGRPGLELYPTLEVVPANNRTATFLAHSAVPLSFTQEDFEQVANGNYLVKVIYLPNPQFQDLAVAGLGEVVSSRLEPGTDPIAEALSRGSILLVVRLGNIDLEAPNTPAMDAPCPYPPAVPAAPIMPGAGMASPGGPPTAMVPGGQGLIQNLPRPGPMVPYGLGRQPMLPPGGPMIPGMLPPPPPGAGAPPGAAPGTPTGARPPKSVLQAADYMEPADGEALKKSSGWLPWPFGKKPAETK